MSSVLRSLMVKVGADLSGFDKSMKTMSKDLKVAGTEMSKVGKTFTLGLTVPILAAAAASFKFASDMQESVNKVDVAFRGNASQVKEWSNTTLKQFGIAKGTALDMAALFGDMATGMGLSTIEASKMSTNLVGLAGDMASFKNIRIDVAETALKSIFTGETESLKNLGIVMTVANLDAFALAKGYEKVTKDMTEAEKVQLRYAFVLEKSKNSIGDFARTGGGAANQMRIFTESLKEVGASFGEQLLPLITPAITKINEVIQSFGKLDDKTKKTILVFAGIAAAVGPVLSTLGGLTTGLSGVMKSVGLAAKAISGGGGMIAALGALLGPAGIALAAIAALAAVIGTIVYIAGKAGREVKQMTEDLIKSHKEEAEAQKAAIDKAAEVRINALNEQQAAEETASTERLKLIETEYEKEVKSAGKKEQALKKNLQERMSALTESHNEEIQRIRDEYGVFEEKSTSKTDIVLQGAEDRKKALDDEVRAAEEAASDQEKAYQELYENIIKEAEKAHKEKVKMLDDEYVKSIRLVDEDLAQKIKAFQDEINGINQKTEEENRILEEQRNNEKIADLQKKVNDAQNDEERKIAQKDLRDEINRINREKEIENRKIQIESLKDQIDEARTNAEDQKNVLKDTLDNKKIKLDEDLEGIKTRAATDLENYKINEADKLKALRGRMESEKIEIDAKAKEEIRLIQEERIEKETAENKKYESAKSNLDKEEIALDGFAERYKEKLEDQLKEKKRIEEEKLKAVKDRISDTLTEIQKGMDGEKAIIDKADAEYATKQAKEEAKEKVMKEYIFPLLPDKATLRTYRPLPGLPTIGEMFPGFASGVKNWAGGLARINERGGEIINLPTGANVIPHDLSTEMLMNTKPNIQILITGNTIANDYDVDRIGDRLIEKIRLKTGLKI